MNDHGFAHQGEIKISPECPFTPARVQGERKARAPRSEAAKLRRRQRRAAKKAGVPLKAFLRRV